MVQGIIDYYGKKAVATLLVNPSSEDQAASADEYIERYGMGAHPRFRMEDEPCRRKLVAEFGHFGWGYMVIGADGKLVGVNLSSSDLEAAVAKGLGLDPTADADEPIHATARLKNQMGGSMLNLSGRTKKSIAATLEVTLSIPAGWHVYSEAGASAVATTLEVAHPSAIQFGDVVLRGGAPTATGDTRLFGPVQLSVPVVVPIGTPIGNYLIHGTVNTMVCNADRCLPPMEIPWKATMGVDF